MNANPTLVVLCMLCLVVGTGRLVLAQPGIDATREPKSVPRLEDDTKPKLRTWTDSSGKFTVEAMLLDFKEGIVRLKKANGTILKVPIEKLSDADREFARRESQQVEKDKGEPGASNRNEGPSYFEVKKDIKKYIGKKVAWLGKCVSSESTAGSIAGISLGSTHTSIYAVVDEKGHGFWKTRSAIATLGLTRIQNEHQPPRKRARPQFAREYDWLGGPLQGQGRPISVHLFQIHLLQSTSRKRFPT